MKKPTFFILGAAKCGTTSLYHYLNAHPDICMSTPKEPRFFEAEYHNGLDYYWKRYFSSVWNGESAIGEARHRNLYLPYVPERIKESVPNAKLIVIVRDPIERAHSHWRHGCSWGLEDLSFEDAISEDLERLQKGITFEGEEGAQLWVSNLNPQNGESTFRTYVDSGHYSDQIERYLRLFSHEDLKIVFLEDLADDPAEVMADLLSFLGVSSSIEGIEFRRYVTNSRYTNLAGEVLKRIGLLDRLPLGIKRLGRKLLNHVGVERRICPSVRKDLAKHYYPFNRDLESLTGRDLSHWDI